MNEFDGYRERYVAEINTAVRFSGQSLDFFTRAKADMLQRLFAELRPSGPLKALDVGCGHGLIHRFLLESRGDLDLTGVDVAKTVLEEARTANPGVQYDSYEGERLPYETGAFDAAFTICVLHHVAPAERDGLLAEMRRVVRPGGLVVAIEHNPLNPLTQYIVRTCPLDENAVLLWPHELRGRFAKAGLCTLARRFLLFTPLSAPIFRRLDVALGWLPAGAQYGVWGQVPLANPVS